MITAVDTSVLLDVFLGDDRHGPASRRRLISAYGSGALIACEVVYAELAPAFGDRALLDRALGEANVQIKPIDVDIAWEAGSRWRRYRQSGDPCSRILADFLIGAHALAAADDFLTRDRGFYETYFPEIGQRAAGR